MSVAGYKLQHACLIAMLNASTHYHEDDKYPGINNLDEAID